MTEAEWLAGTDPVPMLRFLNERDASARKFRLFACTCARRLWPLMSDDRARDVVRDAERFADGLLSEGERREREERFRATFPPRMTPDYPVSPSYLADMVAFYTIWSNSVWDPGHTLHLNEHGAECVSQWVGFTLVFRETGDWEAWPAAKHPVGRAEAETHCRLIRDIFGDPFRPAALDPAWLTWQGGTIPSLARAIYAEGAFDRLPVLADALEEAGCADAHILGHCRGPGPHVCGCWAVDLLVGRR
jgi:hypothetical protein